MFISEQKNLNSVFQDYYIIPDLQRNFAWKKNNAQELFNDLKEETEDFSLNLQNSNSYYFLGSIVLIEGEKPNVFQVIDGQQRLTSLYLMIKAIIDSFEDRDLVDDYFMDINVLKLFYAKWRKNEVSVLKISHLNTVIYGDLFKKIMSSDSKTVEKILSGKTTGLKKSEENFREVYLSFKSLLNGLTNDQLEFLQNYIKDRVLVVRTIAKDFGIAYRIFETLNARGENLTGADLIKNKILQEVSKTSEEKFNIVNEQWNKMIDNLNTRNSQNKSVDPVVYLTQFMSFYYGVKLNEKSLYKVLEKKLKEMNLDEIILLVNKLNEYSEPYSLIIEGSYEKIASKSITELTLMFEFFNNIQLRSLILYVKNFPEEDKNYFLDLALKLEVSRIYSGGYPSQVTNVLQSFYGKNKQENIDTANPQIIDHWKKEFGRYVTPVLKSNIEKLKSNVINMNFTNKQSAFKLIVFIEMFSRKEVFNTDSTDLEHIMPQTLPEERYKTYGISDNDEFESYLYKIGNMTLLESHINKSLKNAAYDDKVVKYKVTNYFMTKRLASNLEQVTLSGENYRKTKIFLESLTPFNNWNKEIIEKRTNELTVLFASLLEESI